MSITEVLLLLLQQTTFFLLLANIYLMSRKVKDLEKRIEIMERTPITIYQYDEVDEGRFG